MRTLKGGTGSNQGKKRSGKRKQSRRPMATVEEDIFTEVTSAEVMGPSGKRSRRQTTRFEEPSGAKAESKQSGPGAKASGAKASGAKASGAKADPRQSSMVDEPSEANADPKKSGRGKKSRSKKAVDATKAVDPTKVIGQGIDISYEDNMMGPIHFAEGILEKSSQKILESAKERRDAVIYVAKRLTMLAVTLSHTVSFKLEEFSKTLSPRSAGFERSKIQGAYKDIKNKNFKRRPVQISLATIVEESISGGGDDSLMDTLKQSTVVETMGDVVQLSEAVTPGNELAHACQVASQKDNFASSSELVAELMPGASRNPFLRKILECTSTNPGDYTDPKSNDDHGYYTRDEPGMKKTVCIRVACIAGDTFEHVIKDPHCIGIIVNLLRSKSPEEAILKYEENMKKDMLTATARVQFYSQRLAIGGILLKSADEAISGVLSKKYSNKPPQEAELALRRALGPDLLRVLQRTMDAEYLNQLLSIDMNELLSIDTVEGDKDKFEEEVMSLRNGNLEVGKKTLIFRAFQGKTDREFDSILRERILATSDSFENKVDHLLGTIKEISDEIYENEKEKIRLKLPAPDFRSAHNQSLVTNVLNVLDKHKVAAGLTHAMTKKAQFKKTGRRNKKTSRRNKKTEQNGENANLFGEEKPRVFEPNLFEEATPEQLEHNPLQRVEVNRKIHNYQEGDELKRLDEITERKRQDLQRRMIDEEREIQREFEIQRAAIRKSADERAALRDLARASES
jgi:hypothetical protein